jgi:NAD(P)-dependent dehydrogenase (short-subunit alcohol dehydrogenase family)
MRTAVVTGANRGIGLELCRQLAARGDTVIGACREPSRELEGLGIRVEGGVDVTDDRTVADFAARLGETRLDLLVNNAGILTREGLDELDFDRIRRQFEVNSLGPLRVTAALRGQLHRGSKVAIITSLMGSMGDNGSGGMYGYRMSKAAVNAAGVSLARDLASDGIAVAILHPGYVRTRMTGGQGSLDPVESVRGLLARIDASTLETTGQFLRGATGEVLPW